MIPWRRGLRELAVHMRHQVAPRRNDSGWIAAQLRGGAVVAVRKNEEGLLVWRIARKDAPTTITQKNAWETELRTFVAHLDLTLATRTNPAANAAEFTETFVPADRA